MEYIDNVYVINLDKDKDRLDLMQQQIPKLGRQFTRISAVNGKLLSKKEISDKTTSMCNLFCTLSMIGCFLSHQKVWQKIIDNNDNYAIVMEDDCELIDSFQDDLKNLLNEIIPLEPDLIYLGCFGACDYDKSKYSPFSHIVNFLYNPHNNQNNNTKENTQGKYYYTPDAPTGTHCYMISNKCARYLLENLNKINDHVDLSMIKHLPKLKAFASKIKLGFQSSSPSQSTQINHKFPILFNSIFDNIKDSNNITYSFYLSTSFIEVFGIPITPYTIIFSILLFVFSKNKYMFTLFTYYLIIEFILDPKSINIIIFLYIINYIIHKFKK